MPQLQVVRAHFTKDSAPPPSPNIAELLECAGFRIRGRRADCAYCQGSSRLTVAFTDQFAFCHRCGWKATIRTLSRNQGIAIAPEAPEHRKARWQTQDFSKWLTTRERILTDHHRRLWRRTWLAHVALQFFPDWDLAWQVLADYYDAEAKLCAGLDALCFEQVGRWLETPETPESMVRSWREDSYARP